MTYDIMKYDVMTYNIMTYDVMTYDIMTYDVIKYDIMTYYVMTLNLGFTPRFWNMEKVFAKFPFALKLIIWVLTTPNNMHESFQKVLFAA